MTCLSSYRWWRNDFRFPLTTLPNVVTSLIQTSVAVKRITKFLSLQELDQKQIEKSFNPGMMIIVSALIYTNLDRPRSWLYSYSNLSWDLTFNCFCLEFYLKGIFWFQKSVFKAVVFWILHNVWPQESSPSKYWLAGSFLNSDNCSWT